MPSLPISPDGLAAEEYRALRATIRERGTARLVVAAAAFLVWPALTVAAASADGGPWLTLLPLIALWGGFEVIYQCHVGVERVGRYLQVKYEGAASLPAWETTAMRLGSTPGAGTGADPLFIRLFVVATLINLAPLVPVGLTTGSATAATVQLTITVVLHVAFYLRLSAGRRFATVQRAAELKLFTQLHTPASKPPETGPDTRPAP
jgi:hypothetical protein